MDFYQKMLNFISPRSNLIEGNKTLSGSAEILHADTPCKTITIQADPDNSDYVYVGKSSSVSNLVHMAKLTPGGAYTFNVTNANMLYVIGTASEKVCFGGEV